MDLKSQNRILITGATGFIGSHLVKDLAEKGFKIRCLVKYSSSKDALDFLNNLETELFYGDLNDKESLENAVKGIDYVFHLGGGGRVGMSKEIQCRINIEGTKNILEACVSNGNIKKFIHVSTCAVMGDIKNGPADETYPLNPANMAYSYAKTEAEKVALSYKDRIHLVVVRFPGVYGIPLIKGEPDRIGGVTPILMIFSAVKHGKWRYVGEGKNFIHLFYIDDAVRGLELSHEKGRAGEIYIIGDKQSIRMVEMVRTAANVLHVEEPNGHVPVSIARIFALVSELGAKLFGGIPVMSREMVTGFISNLYIDTSKARKELGYESKVSLEAGMKQTVEWYKANGYL
ncbi:MAG: NAD-dependent epimerase/dehydratase family protein [Candidatus Paceibacterota bacterium]|jgi:nucleoside-diphosphate-sugar epimerase